MDRGVVVIDTVLTLLVGGIPRRPVEAYTTLFFNFFALVCMSSTCRLGSSFRLSALTFFFDVKSTACTSGADKAVVVGLQVALVGALSGIGRRTGPVGRFRRVRRSRHGHGILCSRDGCKSGQGAEMMRGRWRGRDAYSEGRVPAKMGKGGRYLLLLHAALLLHPAPLLLHLALLLDSFINFHLMCLPLLIQ